MESRQLRLLAALTAILLADVLYEAGLPPEMYSVVTGWPKDIGMGMLTDPAIELITFTGSVPVGDQPGSIGPDASISASGGEMS